MLHPSIVAIHSWYQALSLVSAETNCSIDCRRAKLSGAEGAKLCPDDKAVSPPDSWPHATFDTTCGASKTYTVPIPVAYTCGPRGRWNVWSDVRPFAWPQCTGECVCVCVCFWYTLTSCHSCEHYRFWAGNPVFREPSRFPAFQLKCPAFLRILHWTKVTTGTIISVALINVIHGK